ncbi:hypothetical protein AwDysgo_17240 [Bacteroidales bacterium]|nr:hypothetical protein AwDysgo_17240 [Bacteroidales bacterium]
MESLSKKYELLPTQISAWKGEALKKFAQVFSKEKASSSSNAVDTQILYAQIGVDYTPFSWGSTLDSHY